MTDTKKLWLQNLSGTDVGLGDLGFKIKANKTIDVYKVNPQLKTEVITASLENGSIAKRIQSGKIRVVSNYVEPTPHTLNHVKESSEIVQVTKSKSSVVIDTREMDELSDDDLGDIADYGFEPDADLSNTLRSRTDDGAVVVNQVKDEVDRSEQPQPSTPIPKNEQKSVVMEDSGEGPEPKTASAKQDVADDSKNFISTPRRTEPERYENKQNTQVKQVGKVTVVDKKESSVPEETEGNTEADSDTESFDSQVATKDKSGTVVMKLKEERPKSDS